jgi:hypothetical protein
MASGQPSEQTESNEQLTVMSRRKVVAGVGLFGAALAALSNKAWSQEQVQGSYSNAAVALPSGPAFDNQDAEIRAIKIARAMSAGPYEITKDATIGEMDRHGNLSMVLRKGTNEWLCTPGNENRVGDPPMCVDRIGAQWFKEVMAGRPRPTNTTPGLCYMLCGATQHSNTSALDQTSPAIPIGPHWMILWPFNAAHCGLPTNVRDAGAWIMFAGTPYAYLHVCGSPWVGNTYTSGDQAVWTMRYEKGPDSAQRASAAL